jgi:hypothetical protein
VNAGANPTTLSYVQRERCKNLQRIKKQLQPFHPQPMNKKSKKINVELIAYEA